MDEIEHAVDVLVGGGLVAFPTETVYGLGADATNPTAVERVFTVKGRPRGHPLIVHLPDAGSLDQWAARVSPEARVLAGALWPGPLTLLVARSELVSDGVTGGRPTVALRVPDHPVAGALLHALREREPSGGGGVAGPSANRFGRVSPTTAAHVRADLGADVDLVLDGGPCVVGVESTIVDCTSSPPEVLRLGGVTIDALADVLGARPGLARADDEPDQDGGARAPGRLAGHYAPTARVELAGSAAELIERSAAAAATGARVAVLAPGVVAGLDADVIELEPAGVDHHFAQVLYERLRQADRLGVEHLVVLAPPEGGLGDAVRDRLRRAAHG